MNINYRSAIESKIERIISNSDVPEDYKHAKSVRDWLLKFKPDADWALKLAGFAHDIERALPRRKVHRSKYSNYNDFKRAHAQNSAKIIEEILDKYPVSNRVKNRVINLIENHELSESKDPDIIDLIDADGVSFFEVNLPYYAERNDDSEVFFRMKWGYGRLSERARKFVKKFYYEDERLNEFLGRIILNICDC